MSIRNWVFGLVLVLAPGADAIAATSVLPPGAQLLPPGEWPVDASRIERDVAEALAAIERGDASGGYARLRATSDPRRFEAAAAALIAAVQARPSTPAADALLQRLQHEPIVLYRRHDESGADWFVPVFDVPGRAGSARRVLAFAQQREHLQLALERSPAQAIATAPQSALLVAAIERVTPRTVRALATLALAGQGELPGAAWAALAQRDPRAPVLAALLARAEPVDVMPLLQRLPSQLEPAAALAFVEAALSEPTYASAAVLALGRLASRSPAAEAALISQLGHPQNGASAAAALAQLAVPDRLARIDAALAKTDDPRVLAKLALALRLEGSPAALARLQRLRDDPRLAPQARSELQR